MTTVNVLVPEKDASAFYRLTEPARVLKAAGYDVETFKMWKGPGEAREADVYVTNRPILHGQFLMIEWLKSIGKKVIVDMDDDFEHLVPEHAMFGWDTQWLRRSCEIADVVTCSTPALVDVYGYGHGVVVANCVPRRYLDIVGNAPHTTTWVGWYGTVSSHPNDLLAADMGIGKALKRTGAHFAYVGNPNEKDLIRAQIGTQGQMEVSPFVILHVLPEAIANFDVGVVPLQRCLFNEGKSWLKGLEMAAVGVPFVASPTPAYAALHEMGAGVLAETRNDWSRAVQELVKDTDYRAQVAARGWHAAQRLTIEGNLEQWANVWLDAEKAESHGTIATYDAEGQALDPIAVGGAS